jgi:hypothetical protein
MASLLPTIQDDVREQLERIEDMLDKLPDAAYLNSKNGPTKKLGTFGSNPSMRMMFNRNVAQKRLLAKTNLKNK